ncbi:hypothetical protein F4604DRAFT_70318 [Suillus subluteus]|nr:hypothetical protein F4604DRAFT_70318 [Suillus subluteus]
MDWVLVLCFLIDCVLLSLLALLFCSGFQSYCIPIIGRFATSLLLTFFQRRHFQYPWTLVHNTNLKRQITRNRSTSARRVTMYI